VLCQSFTDFEIIVSDNASEEDIGGVIQEAQDPRIRFYQQPRNLGPRGNGLFLQTLLRGEYFLSLCSDDLLLPDCLEKAVRTLDLNPTRGGVVYMAAHYGNNGFEFLSTMPSIEYADADIYRENRDVWAFTFTSPSLCLYRRTNFERVGGYDQELLAVGDWEIYSRMIRKGGGICYLHEVLAIMRLHDNRHSNTSALHWDFYHDVLILSRRPESRWAASFKAKVVMEQLLWDLRLRRPPWATLRHAWRYGALKSFLALLPYEITRRALIKIAVAWRRLHKRAEGPSSISRAGAPFDREALDAFWKDMTQ
jgi:GT2 family glycosyltransferase